MCDLVSMSDQEFEAARARLRQIITNLRELASEAAAILSKMSTLQLRVIKKDFKGIWSADQIDRLVLFGRGRIGVHLAVAQKCLPASLLRRLPTETLEVVNNPESEVELWDDHLRNVKSKQVRDLTAFDYSQLVDNRGRIRSITDQQRYHLQLATKVKLEGDVEEPENIIVKGKYLLIKGKVSTIKVEIKMLRRFIA